MPHDALFLDSNGLVALLNADDWQHTDAVSTFEDVGASRRPLITTDLVLAEAGNGLARTPAREQLTVFVRELLREPQAHVVFVDQSTFERGLDWYARHTDKAWGLVDCVSFAIMSAEGLHDAFTADRHFEQAGFRAVLKSAR